MKRSPLKLLVLFIAVSALGSSGAHSHDIVPGRPQSQPILIEHAMLHIGNGTVKKDSSLLFDEGVITRIGRDGGRPEDTLVIDGRDKHVYPGLIDAFTDIGLREITAVDVTVDSSERGDENPNVRSWIAFNPDSELIPVARAGGVLVAHVVPGGRWIRGQSAVLQLDGWAAKDMLLRARAGCVWTGKRWCRAAMISRQMPSGMMSRSTRLTSYSIKPAATATSTPPILRLRPMCDWRVGSL